MTYLVKFVVCGGGSVTNLYSVHALCTFDLVWVISVTWFIAHNQGLHSDFMTHMHPYFILVFDQRYFMQDRINYADLAVWSVLTGLFVLSYS